MCTHEATYSRAKLCINNRLREVGEQSRLDDSRRLLEGELISGGQGCSADKEREAGAVYGVGIGGGKKAQWHLFWFPRDVVTTYHKLGGFEQQKFILS